MLKKEKKGILILPPKIKTYIEKKKITRFGHAKKSLLALFTYLFIHVIIFFNI